MPVLLCKSLCVSLTHTLDVVTMSLPLTLRNESGVTHSSCLHSKCTPALELMYGTTFAFSNPIQICFIHIYFAANCVHSSVKTSELLIVVLQCEFVGKFSTHSTEIELTEKDNHLWFWLFVLIVSTITPKCAVLASLDHKQKQYRMSHYI